MGQRNDNKNIGVLVTVTHIREMRKKLKMQFYLHREPTFRLTYDTNSFWRKKYWPLLTRCGKIVGLE